MRKYPNTMMLELDPLGEARRLLSENSEVVERRPETAKSIAGHLEVDCLAGPTLNLQGTWHQIGDQEKPRESTRNVQ